MPFWSRRHLVKPGITGWAQVHRGYTADADGTAEKLAYDLWYLRHRSLVLDLAICVKTVTTLLTGTGAR
ncbi:MAG: sugar transferase [Actinobacteria bacterium]|nr:sugar transferase [Actinomycetota bacterium]